MSIESWRTMLVLKVMKVAFEHEEHYPAAL